MTAHVCQMCERRVVHSSHKSISCLLAQVYAMLSVHQCSYEVPVADSSEQHLQYVIAYCTQVSWHLRWSYC
jgi:hypothetical protein